MRILIVCSGTSGSLSPFIEEQVNSLIKLGIEIKIFQIKKKGAMGYISCLRPMIREINEYKPFIIHAHYGLSGLLANLQRQVPVVTTFHGCDINDKRILRLSRWAHRLSEASIFVNPEMIKKVNQKINSYNIPCGINTDVFSPVSRIVARNSMKLKLNEIIILFSSAFDNPVKNFLLARNACLELEKDLGKTVRLIELKGYDRYEVNLLLNAADCALMTSISEGSPQFIKEAMACNCPIVSTNVGDVSWIIDGIEGCYIAKSNPKDVSDRLKDALAFGRKTKGLKRIMELGLDTETIAKSIEKVYHKVLF